MRNENITPARIVVAGAGLIGRAHIERIVAEPQATLAGIVDISPATEQHAAALGVPYSADLEALLREAKPDGVIIALPNQAHFTAGMAAIKARVAVLMEKPVCETVAQALELADAADAETVPVLVGHHRRHSAIIRHAKQILTSGRLGHLIAVNALCWWRKPDSYFEGPNVWRRQPGGGPVLINLIHAIDDLRNLCGEIESVQALTSNQTRGFQVEDTAAVLLRFANGALGTLTLSDAAPSPWSWELTSGENPAYPRTQQPCYFLAGSQASLSLPQLELWHHPNEGHWFTPIESRPNPTPDEDPLANQIRHFCDVATRRAQPLLDARGGAKTLHATLAVLESASTGNPVRLL
ncbi:MAG: Gfo/Idh/MocA family oxidoreductase [Bryobacterales bacterium]|nr:Gfo/Idh/MocA family oxidoreductase [Bryobacterales bacterium]